MKSPEDTFTAKTAVEGPRAAGRGGDGEFTVRELREQPGHSSRARPSQWAWSLLWMALDRRAAETSWKL